MIRTAPRLVALLLACAAPSCLGAGSKPAGSAAGAGETGSGAAAGSRAGWVLLEAGPRLWSEPSERASGRKGSLPVASRVEPLERREVEGIPWVRIRAADLDGWLPEALLAPPPAEIPPEALTSIGDETVDRRHGIGPEFRPPDLVALPAAVGYEKGREYRLRAAAATALLRLIEAAESEGVRLKVVSGYRPYELQRDLYLRKLQRGGWDQKTVARPGHSEHQLGVAVDFTDGDAKTLLLESFGDSPAGRWLARRAPEFGFAASYTRHNEAATGYAPEPWHYRYFGTPLAAERHREALGPADAKSDRRPGP